MRKVLKRFGRGRSFLPEERVVEKRRLEDWAKEHWNFSAIGRQVEEAIHQLKAKLKAQVKAKVRRLEMSRLSAEASAGENSNKVSKRHRPSTKDVCTGR